VYRPVNDQGVWTIRTNQELRELNKNFDLIVRRGLEWLRDVIRMDQTRMLMNIFKVSQRAEVGRLSP
jgi:hypothetical protein